MYDDTLGTLYGSRLQAQKLNQLVVHIKQYQYLSFADSHGYNSGLYPQTEKAEPRFCTAQ